MDERIVTGTKQEVEIRLEKTQELAAAGTVALGAEAGLVAAGAAAAATGLGGQDSADSCSLLSSTVGLLPKQLRKKSVSFTSEEGIQVRSNLFGGCDGGSCGIGWIRGAGTWVEFGSVRETALIYLLFLFFILFYFILLLQVCSGV